MRRCKLFVLVLLAKLLSLSTYSTNPPQVFPGDFWQTATPESQGIAAENLQRALDYLWEKSNGARTDEMVIIRNGRLIWKGPNAHQVHAIYSCTKTFTSTVLGLLITEGLVRLDDYAIQYWPALDDSYFEYAQIQLRHLTTMTSGYDSLRGDGWQFYQTDRAKHLESVLSYTTPGPPMFLAGISFKYHDPAVHLLGYILMKASGESLEQLFRKRAAEPIGMKQFSWSDYGEKDGIQFNNPAGTPGDKQGGVKSNALDLARYGWLYLNHGHWDGVQILDWQFIEQAASTQVQADVQTQYFDLTGRYGFFWWTNGIQADGTRPWPSAPPKTYSAHGAGRNFIFVIPEWNMVIVRLSPVIGGQVQTESMKEDVWDEFFSLLKEGMKE